MIEVIEPSKELKRCGGCGSLLTYEKSDVQEVKPPGYVVAILAIRCPICKKYVNVGSAPAPRSRQEGSLSTDGIW